MSRRLDGGAEDVVVVVGGTISKLVRPSAEYVGPGPRPLADLLRAPAGAAAG